MATMTSSSPWSTAPTSSPCQGRRPQPAPETPIEAPPRSPGQGRRRQTARKTGRRPHLPKPIKPARCRPGPNRDGLFLASPHSLRVGLPVVVSLRSAPNHHLNLGVLLASTRSWSSPPAPPCGAPWLGDRPLGSHYAHDLDLQQRKPPPGDCCAPSLRPGVTRVTGGTGIGALVASSS